MLELDFWAVKFLFFPRRDLNSHHWYTAAPIYIYIYNYVLVAWVRNSLLDRICHVCRMPHYLHVIDILQRLLRRNRLVERWWPLTRLHYPTVSITSLLTCGNQNTRSIDMWPLYLYDILFINLFSWWVSDCCLMPAQQFFSYIVGRTSL